MEVHHHGHHGGVKNWKTYLWEFLMLFFAVFCGFLAEWRLEVMIENHREEAYVKSLVDDIRADVAQTEKLITDIQGRIVKTDSLLQIFSSESIKTNSIPAQKLWLSTIGFPDFVQNDRTIQQLKNSGSLRLIRDKGVSDKIMEYDQAVRSLTISQNNMNVIAADNRMYSQMFDLIAIGKKSSQAIPLGSTGVDLLSQAYANRYFWRINLVGLQRKLTALQVKGKEVSDYIIKRYGI